MGKLPPKEPTVPSPPRAADPQSHQYIKTDPQLAQFVQDNQDITWLGFDTEFISEKRFYPLLCLIQVITEHGLYVLDTLALKSLDPFLALIENPHILKITHAGENDYRLLNALYGTYPKNLFDTQIAMGFLSHTYPIGFQALVEREFQVTLNKSFAVTDWEARPMTAQQLNYALNDVLYLPELHRRLTEQLVALDRQPWCQEEVAKLESPQYYETDTLQDLLKSTLNTQLNQQERIFLVRLLSWRLDEAKRRNMTKESVLPGKTMTAVAKGIGNGRSAIAQNRMIADRLVQTHWPLWERLYQAPITADERALLKSIPHWEEETPEQAMSAEFLYLLMRDRCFKAGMAHTIVLSKAAFRGPDERLDSAWRRELLGDSLIAWIRSQQQVAFDVQADRCVVKLVD
jgi:ribonuclease D